MNKSVLFFIALAFMFFIGLAFFLSYTPSEKPTKTSYPLPYLGFHDINETDTVYHTIPDYSFIDQDSAIITPATFKNKIYVTDFFFTSCPSICPPISKQKVRLYKKFKDEENFSILSHSIDTRRDSVPRLKKYATAMGATDSNRWHFVTGDRKKIHGIAKDYISTAMEDENAEGGYEHSGYLVLVDRNRRIRSYCSGLDSNQVTEFMKDIEWLLVNE